jgi:lysophospholipase L1-like esterase
MAEHRYGGALVLRLALVVCATVIALALLEGGMRVAGSTMRWAQHARNERALGRKHEVRVLCLGESTTAGVGDHGRYPDMLEEMLNAQPLGVRFAVVNQGRIGATTNEIIAGLEDDLETFAPDVVAVMMGINDGGKTQAWGEVIAPGAQRWYGTLRLYKLYRLMRAALAQRISPPEALEVATRSPTFVPTPEHVPEALRDAEQLIDRQEHARAEAMLNDLLREDPDLAKGYVELARLYRETHRAEEAHRLLLRGADTIAAPSVGLSAALGRAYFERGDIDDAIRTYRLIIDSLVDPADVWDQTYYRVALADMYEANHQLEQAERTPIEIVEQIDPWNDIAYRYLIELYERQRNAQRVAECRAAQERIRNEQVSPVTRQNFLILQQAVRARGIPLVAVQYPGRALETLGRLLDWDTHVVFVDNAFFKQLEQANGYDALYTDRFAGDFGHLTEAGNRALARSVAQAIVENVLRQPFTDPS